ncbi:MAG: Gfo/Idh/MocA family oxidoreductase [Pyrinomonadaceae bacterium]
MKDKVGIGLIGTGFARKVQLPAFLACDRAWIASVSSASYENAQATADEFGIGHFSAYWRDTILHPEVDIVCITTPPYLHREMTLFAIESGKHILCEKPMAMNVGEAQEMCDAAADKPILTLIDHELRFQPGRQLAKQMLHDGAIGKVRHCKAIFQAPHRGDPDIPWNWWSDAAAGGGALGAINSHIIDSFNWFLGSNIVSVFCQLQSHIKERPDPNGRMRPVTTDDEAHMLLRFADGPVASDATGLVSVSMVEYPKYQNRVEFYGSKGALRIDHRGDVFITIAGEGDWRSVETPILENVGRYPDTGFPRGFMGFARKIIDAIRHGETSISDAATFEDGLEVQRVLDASRISSSQGHIVVIER